MQNGQSSKPVTVVTGTLSGSTFTVRDAETVTFDDDITVGNLNIEVGDYIGIWLPGSGDTKFADSASWSATDSGQPPIMRSSVGGVTSAPSASDTITVSDWTGIYNNVGATVTFDAYK